MGKDLEPSQSELTDPHQVEMTAETTSEEETVITETTTETTTAETITEDESLSITFWTCS